MSQPPQSAPSNPTDTSETAEEAGQPERAAETPSRIVVVTPEGIGVAHTGGDDSSESHPRNPAELVEQPAKVMRIGSMVKQLLEEVRSAPLDDKGRARLAEIHERSIAELKDGLAPELVSELDRIALPFRDEAPSDAELRIAQAQLVGWLEGLFHGIQTALVAQQMAAQAQLQQMRALPRAPCPTEPAAPWLFPLESRRDPTAQAPPAPVNISEGRARAHRCPAHRECR